VSYGGAASASGTSFAPTLGPIAGGTLVEALGTGFVNTKSLACKFGTRVTGATWVSTSKIQCRSASTASATTVTVYVSNNGYDFASIASSFTYYGA
jgi:hypothetical protein